VIIVGRDIPWVLRDGETVEEAKIRKKKEDLEIQEKIAKKEAEKAATNKSKANAAGTITIANDPKLNITTGIDKLQEIQEKNMANELDVTEADRIKHDKIEKQKQRDNDVAAAIAIAADLKGDIKKIKEELCEGPDCLKKQVENKFGEIDAKIAKLDEKSVDFFVCERCSYPNVPALSSFCPNCGAKIPSWMDDNGQPVVGWTPYYETHKEE